jgi:hypothetical protein
MSTALLRDVIFEPHTRESDRATGGDHGPCNSFLRDDPNASSFTESRDEHQGVVDRDTESDRVRQRRDVRHALTLDDGEPFASDRGASGWVLLSYLWMTS